MNKDWLDIDVLEDYLDGKLDAKTMNRVEREALEDPFVAEALAGLSAAPKRSLQSISLLQKQLQERIAEQRNVKKTSVITWQRLSIAATAAVLFVAVSIVFWMKENNRQNELAKLPKKVDVTIAQNNKSDVATVEPPAANSSTAKATVIAAEDEKIDRAIAAAKTNAYASLRKNSPPQPSVSADEKVSDASPVVLNEQVVTGYASPMRKQNVTGVEKEVIAANLDSSRLNEVVVSSPSAKAKKEVSRDSVALALSGRVAGIQTRVRGLASAPTKMVSSPVGGWDKMSEYIDEHNRFGAEKKIGQSVQLSFRIDKNGVPADVKVIRGAESKYEDEAIRLLTKGPKWEIPKKASSRMIISIDF